MLVMLPGVLSLRACKLGLTDHEWNNCQYRVGKCTSKFGHVQFGLTNRHMRKRLCLRFFEFAQKGAPVIGTSWASYASRLPGAAGWRACGERHGLQVRRNCAA